MTTWIAVSGLDGSGKTGAVEYLADSLHGRVHSFRLPMFDFAKRGSFISGNGTTHGDVHTDRLLFAADARLADTVISGMLHNHDFLVSQRAWMDNYVFGAVQGTSYEETTTLLKTSELNHPNFIMYLAAEPSVAFERVRHDPFKDKYETLDFITQQHAETLRFIEEVRDGHPALESFQGIPHYLLDTTHLSPEETGEKCLQKVKEIL